MGLGDQHGGMRPLGNTWGRGAGTWVGDTGLGHGVGLGGTWGHGAGTWGGLGDQYGGMRPLGQQLGTRGWDMGLVYGTTMVE